MTQEMRERINGAADAIRDRSSIEPKIAIVLGSGLSAAVDRVDVKCEIDDADIPGWPRSTVQGHSGRLVLGMLEGVPVLVQQGRVHYYECGDMQEVVFPTRVFAALGAKTLFVTNASGGINVDIAPGSLVAVTDHINFMGSNPLIGPNDDAMGPRFPDMTYAYDREHLDLLLAAAKEMGISLRKGVYAAFTGPSYETPAEIRMARTMGADVVGMSTVPEVIAANHAGMKVVAVSCVSNHAAGVTADRLRHEDVLARMRLASGSLASLIASFVRSIR